MHRTSARNQLRGTVTSVRQGVANSLVTIDVDGTEVKADVMTEDVDELGLAPGVPATAIFRPTSVMIVTDDVAVSARNRLRGTIRVVEKGSVNGLVRVALPGGQQVESQVTLGSINRLHLVEGKAVTAVVKATDVVVAVDD
ncbi:MAG: TOBE domain-containing protein [Coriobacteriales bacterium]|jgi:molybdate transport system regulatory protein